MAINHGPVVAGDGCDTLTGEPLRRTAGGFATAYGLQQG